MKKLCNILALLVITALAVGQQAVTHSQFQAVNADGSSAFVGEDVVVLEGVILNNPEDNLSPEPDSSVIPWFMGGQWQIFVQGEGGDLAGTACWMGQNYGNRPDKILSYTDQQWIEELCRLNRDGQTGYVLRAGDRVRITGSYMFYGGKININENHQTDPEFDFTIELLKPAVGLPAPEEITLADIKDENDTAIFDQTRQAGAERYQARRVRISQVSVSDPNNWAPGGTITIADSTGRSLAVKLGLGEGIARYGCPTGIIDVIGIFNQEGAGFPPNLMAGYQLLVLNHNGNPLVLGDTGLARGNLGGDINGDFIVDISDFAELAQSWLTSMPGLFDCGL